MAKRSHRHGKNWRQVYINCGGMCLNCGAVDGLELHEPFGEDHYGWGMFQSRILLCHNCHSKVEHGNLFGGNRYIKPSMLSIDIDAEIRLYGGYDQWMTYFNIQDTFAILVNINNMSKWYEKEYYDD